MAEGCIERPPPALDHDLHIYRVARITSADHPFGKFKFSLGHPPIPCCIITVPMGMVVRYCVIAVILIYICQTPKQTYTDRVFVVTTTLL